MKKQALIMFGGQSAEHEVSIITGLQVLENIDKEAYEPFSVLLDQDGIYYLLPGITDRKGYHETKRIPIKFGRDKQGSYFQQDKQLQKKQYVDVAYLAFHGGNGEDGTIQGMLE